MGEGPQGEQPLSTAQGSQDRLESWKEIAAYLNHPVRTVQRWEKKAGLPVQRHPTARVGTVYAFKSELDAWWKNRPSGLEREETTVTRTRRRWLVSAMAAAAVVAVGTALSLWFLRGPVLAETDYILLAEFENRTGDSVFDGILRDALAVKLDESPYLNLVSDRRLRETLQLMGRPTEEPVVGPTAREVCLRQGTRAVVSGSIAALGSSYLLTLNATDCHSGESLAREQTEARTKEDVIGALGQAGSHLRRSLGESLASLERFDAPLEQVTTSSLEALRLYTLGQQIRIRDRRAPIPYFERAIELDPNFARAYAVLGMLHDDGGRKELGNEFRKKAFDLRHRVSERERFYIAGHYYHHVTGEIEKSREIYELWTRTYPRDWTPYNNLSTIYRQTAQFDKGLATALEAVRLEPNHRTSLNNLARAYMRLNRLEEAKAAFERVLALEGYHPRAHLKLYLLAFMEGNREEMERHVAAVRGRSGEGALLRYQTGTHALAGKLGEANEFLEKVIARGRRGTSEGSKSFLATTLARAALWDAEFGYNDRARKRAREAAPISSRIGALVWVGIALARVGDLAQAEAVADELVRLRPTDTLINCRDVVSIRALIELQRGNPAEAIELLKGALQDELGGAAGFVAIYTRGQAYLRMGAGNEAAAEFQKIVENPASFPWFPYHTLAHLGLGRAYALAGEEEKSGRAYEKFFELWKDADPDIPILLEAKAEYDKLQATPASVPAN